MKMLSILRIFVRQVYELEHPNSNVKHTQDRAKHAAIMIWLGILIDGIPESLIIGVLTVSGKTSSMLAFIIGVFLSNFPEVQNAKFTHLVLIVHSGNLKVTVSNSIPVSR